MPNTVLSAVGTLTVEFESDAPAPLRGLFHHHPDLPWVLARTGPGRLSVTLHCTDLAEFLSAVGTLEEVLRS